MRMIDGPGITMVDGIDIIITTIRNCITSCATIIGTRIAEMTGIGKRGFTPVAWLTPVQVAGLGKKSAAIRDDP